MKSRNKILLGALILATLRGIAMADTSTTRIGLIKPSIGSTGWGTKWNTNADTIDSAVALQSATNTFSASNVFSATNTFSLANYFLGQNIFSGVNTFNAGQIFNYGVMVTSANVTLSVTSAGVGIGTNTAEAMLHVGPVHDSVGKNATIMTARAYTGSSNAHSRTDISTFAGDAGTSAASYDSALQTTGPNNHGHIVAYQSGLIHSSQGTLDDIYDFFASPTNNGGNVTRRTGYYVQEIGGSSITINQFGVYIESLTKGTTNYAIYTAGSTPSVFGGQIRGANGISGAKIKGTTTNDNATAGDYGEYKETLVSAATNVGTSGTVFDATSIILSSGDYNLSGSIIYRRNAATFTSTDLEIGISVTAGNSATGLVNNSNYVYDLADAPVTFTNHTIAIPTYRVSLANSTTYYLKALVDVYTAGTPQYTAKISAVRIR